MVESSTILRAYLVHWLQDRDDPPSLQVGRRIQYLAGRKLLASRLLVSNLVGSVDQDRGRSGRVGSRSVGVLDLGCGLLVGEILEEGQEQERT